MTSVRRPHRCYASHQLYGAFGWLAEHPSALGESGITAEAEPPGLYVHQTADECVVHEIPSVEPYLLIREGLTLDLRELGENG